MDKMSTATETSRATPTYSVTLQRVYETHRSNGEDDAAQQLRARFDAVVHAMAHAKEARATLLTFTNELLPCDEANPVEVVPDVVARVVEIKRASENSAAVQSATVVVGSERLHVAALMAVVDKLVAKHEKAKHQSKVARPCFFEQKRKFDTRYNPSFDRNMEMANEPKHLSFVRYPLTTNKTFASLFGEHIRNVERRVRFFLEKEDWYREKGVPYQLGLMLTGETGTGKSSVIKAIASASKRHVVNVNFANIRTATQLKRLFYSDDLHVYDGDDLNNTTKYNVPVSQRLYVLEEIDALGAEVVQRRPSSTPVAGAAAPAPDQLTLGDILQVLDGSMETHGRVVIVTSNHPERLDPALMRPGRIDVHVNFGKAEAAAVAAMYRFMLDAEFPAELVPELPDRQLSHATCMDLLVGYAGANEAPDPAEVLAKLKALAAAPAENEK